ncbi:MAG: DUF3784 domain-containing protein [Bacteroidota bacterium]
MILTIVFLIAAVFVMLAFGLTEQNAPTLLAGYNQMTEEERAQVNLKGFLRFFKGFHLILGVSLGVFSWIAFKIFGETGVGLVLGFYPVLAYTFFIIRSKKYWQGSSPRNNALALGLLVLVMVGLLGLFFVGNHEGKLDLQQEAITISGLYGVTIPYQRVKEIRMVEALPSLTMKTNGYSLGDVQKGFFRTEEGQRIKLLINARQNPYILIIPDRGTHCYFSGRSIRNTDLIAHMQAHPLLTDKVKF